MLSESGFIDTVLDTDDLLVCNPFASWDSRLQEVFEVIYGTNSGSGCCIESFHKKQGSINVKLSHWVDGERSVSYRTTVQAPATFTNITDSTDGGTGTELNIEEAQRVFWTSISGELMPDPFIASTPGSAGMSSTSSKTSASDLPSEPPISFTVVCTPQLISGGDRFFTELEFHFRKRAAGMGGGVRAMCSVKVEAHVWGIQSTIEPWMMAETQKHLTEFFPFMSEFFHMNSKAAMTPALLEADEPAAVGQSTASVSARKRQLTALASEHVSGQATTSPNGSSGEEFYDAEEAVPRGVRAAVQMFEGGNVMGAAKRPAYRSRSPSPQPKLTRLPIHSILETGTNNTTPPTPPSPSGQTLPTPRTPHSARSPLTHEVHARRVSAAGSERDTPRDPELTPRLEPTFSFRRHNYSKKGPKRSLDDASDRDRMDSPSTVAHIIPSATDTNASTTSEAAFPQSSLEPRFPGFDSDPIPHDASMFAMHSVQEAAPEVSDPGSHDGDSSAGEHLSAGPGPGRTWSGRTNNNSAAQTEATLEFLFHDAVSDRARRISGDSGSQSQSQSTAFESTAFESAVPDSVSAGNSTANLQEERFRLSLESVSWKLGAAEQRIDDLSQRVRDCVQLVHDVQEGSTRESSELAGSAGDVSRASLGPPITSGNMLGYGSRITEGDSDRNRVVSLPQSSEGFPSARSTASGAALATAGGFAVGVALGVGAVAGMMFMKPNP